MGIIRGLSCLFREIEFTIGNRENVCESAEQRRWFVQQVLQKLVRVGGQERLREGGRRVQPPAEWRRGTKGGKEE